MLNGNPDNAFQLGAADARAAIDEGLLTSQELVAACLARIEQVDGEIGAWAHLDPDLALERARAADAFRRSGLRVGPLHGIPVGIKDIIDTRDYPTERGTPLHRGRQPARDATLVSLLREAGAIILGKTVTAELAVLSPGKTRNPHNPAHSPGGSSSGSAAAVSAAMVPLAVGTQTNGSIVRPASYCGVYGFKPSYGRISRHGVLRQSPPLDQIGVFGRSLEDTALIADVLMRFDAQDEAMAPVAPPCIAEVMAEAVPADPHIAFIRTPRWDQVEPVSKDAFRELIDSANQGGQGIVEIFDLPPPFDELYQDHQIIMEADLARHFDAEYRAGKDQLSDVLREMIERGQRVAEAEYEAAVGRIGEYRDHLDEVFDAYDAIMTPATTGPAPAGLESTGSPIMCTIWTLCGVPALSVPLLQSPDGLPIGVQLVGARDDDARLFRTCRWLLDHLND